MTRAVYSAPDTAQAQWVRDRLEESGIPVEVALAATVTTLLPLLPHSQ